MDATKPTNPKDAIGSDKLPLHLWPTTATAAGSIGMLDGALKYGRSNFRVVGIRASIYIDAAKRHLDAWFEGEECAPDTGIPHLCYALANIAIIVDARAAGKLNDDRMVRGTGYRKLVEELTPHVKRLKELHKDRKPKHYTIADSLLGNVAEYLRIADSKNPATFPALVDMGDFEKLICAEQAGVLFRKWKREYLRKQKGKRAPR